MEFRNCFSSGKSHRKDEEKKLQMEKEIEELIIPYGYKIYSFEYYPNIFGNMVLKLIKADKVETFVIDRGDIFYNNSIIRDDTYQKNDNDIDDRFKELIKIIKNVLL